MTDAQLQQIRRRFLALPVVVVACVLASFLRIRAVGASYDYPITGYEGETITVENLHVDPPTMARVVDVHEGPDGTPIATIEALEPANGFLFVSLEDQGGMSQLRVDPGPIVVVDGANFNGWRTLVAATALSFAVAGFLCAWGLHTLLKNSWYGYEMASLAGGALFCLVEAAVFGSLLFMERAHEFTDFAVAVTGLANDFVNLMLWPMSIAALFVCASNVALLRREGHHPLNALGIAASLAWALACIVLRRTDAAVFDSEGIAEFVQWTMVDSALSIGVCYALALFVGTCLCAYGAARHVPSQPRDYLIVLGCALRPDGSPTPLLAGRVNAALDYARTQEQAGGHLPTFVPSGGQGADEACAEAESMRRYLVAQGVDDARIRPEDRSTSTRENFALSAQVIEADGGAGHPVAFATTNYHVFRSYVYAHEAGLPAEGIAAPTKLYFWPNAFLREFVGLIASRWLTTLLSYLAVAAVYLVAEYALLLTFR